METITSKIRTMNDWKRYAIKLFNFWVQGGIFVSIIHLYKDNDYSQLQKTHNWQDYWEQKIYFLLHW